MFQKFQHIIILGYGYMMVVTQQSVYHYSVYLFFTTLFVFGDCSSGTLVVMVGIEFVCVCVFVYGRVRITVFQPNAKQLTHNNISVCIRKWQYKMNAPPCHVYIFVFCILCTVTIMCVYMWKYCEYEAYGAADI